LSGRGLCDELITRPEESYQLCCVIVCDLEISRMGAVYIYDISRLRVNYPLVVFWKHIDISCCCILETRTVIFFLCFRITFMSGFVTIGRITSLLTRMLTHTIQGGASFSVT